jgi:hypothetical protein
MKKRNMSLQHNVMKNPGKNNIFSLDFIIFAIVSLILWSLMLFAVGHSVMHHSVYDEHTLQALAWRKCEISLAKYREGKWETDLQPLMYLNGNTDSNNEISYHELAKYKNNVYVSFPPTPTFIELPFTFIFGRNTPNTFVLLFFTWAAMLFSFFILLKLTENRMLSYLICFSFFWGSTIFYLSLSGAVWHQGHLYGLFFAILALFILLYAGRPDILLAGSFCLALAVGCRPFYLFMAPFYLYHAFKRFPKASTFFFVILGLIPPGLFYALYNYVRFDSFFEIGHKYLPWESTLEHGIFSLHYFPANIYHALIHPPEWNKAKDIVSFNGAGTGLWFSSPIILLGFAFFFKKICVSLVKVFARKKKSVKEMLKEADHDTSDVHGMENKVEDVFETMNDAENNGVKVEEEEEKGEQTDTEIPGDTVSTREKKSLFRSFLIRFISLRTENIPLLEVLISALTILAIWFCLLLYHSNGWYQFGYRFSVDLVPLLLFFFGRTFKKNHIYLIPICQFSIAVNIYGAFWFYILGQ